MSENVQTSQRIFSVGTACTLVVFAVAFNYLSIVLSSVIYGDTGPAAFAPINVIGANIFFYGLPYALSLLYCALCTYVLIKFFSNHLGSQSYIHYWGTIILAALAGYAILSVPILFFTQGTHGLGMAVIFVIQQAINAGL